MIAIDVGGTFTDTIAIDEKGNITAVKVPTDVNAMENSVIEGARRVGIKNHDMLNHASTCGLNAILTRNFPKVAFLTTEGHRDILDFARAWKPMESLTDADWRRGCGDSGRPFAERYLRRGIRERITSKGKVLIPFDEEQARKEIEVLKKCRVKGVAICLINAYINGEHERKLEALVREIMGDVAVSISSEVSPLGKEYARASTTVMDVIMKMVYGAYINRLQKGLKGAGFTGDLNLVDSAAMLIPYDFAMEKPSRIMYSGPAAGTVSSARLGSLVGESNIICCDVGGTSTDISLIRNGRPLVKTEYEIEHDVIVNTLSNEIFSIGQGGGSIAHVGPFGELRVGPEGAGADPGPACYGSGTQPTLVDAFLLMGILDEKKFLGGEKLLYPELSGKAFKDLPLKADFPTKIRQTYELGLTNIAEGIAGVTIERGIDARDYVLFAYGSAGPMMLPQLMERLEVKSVIVPPYPGHFCALGLTSSDLTYTDYRSAYITLKPDATTARKIDEVYTRMEEAILAKVRQDVKQADVRFIRSFDGWYAGQTWETPFIKVPSGRITEKSIEALIEAFNEGYLAMWGNKFPHLPVMACSYRTSCILPITKIEYKTLPARKTGRPQSVVKHLNYMPEAEAKVMEYERQELYAGDTVAGPAIIREPMSTTMVCAGQVATIGRYGEIHIERGP
ncbi:MAG TPA: hydantoinase/oxoprolinase family protein [Dehalococcoidales bacterium]|nr:hydantoinase/oxoprolinase family protein [Dehalococcoidales bacterium]